MQQQRGAGLGRLALRARDVAADPVLVAHPGRLAQCIPQRLQRRLIRVHLVHIEPEGLGSVVTVREREDRLEGDGPVAEPVTELVGRYGRLAGSDREQSRPRAGRVVLGLEEAPALLVLAQLGEEQPPTGGRAAFVGRELGEVDRGEEAQRPLVRADRPVGAGGQERGAAEPGTAAAPARVAQQQPDLGDVVGEPFGVRGQAKGAEQLLERVAPTECPRREVGGQGAAGRARAQGRDEALDASLAEDPPGAPERGVDVMPCRAGRARGTPPWRGGCDQAPRAAR